MAGEFISLVQVKPMIPSVIYHFAFIISPLPSRRYNLAMTINAEP
jgi:hypothetical protein